MSILCAVDFSKASAVALQHAARVASAFAQPLTVVTVGDPLIAAAEQVQLGENSITVLTRALGEFVDETLGAGEAGRHRLSVPVGDPAGEILREADAQEAALVVLATQGTSGMKKFVFGSVAERVLRETTRPVLVVPPAAASQPIRTLGSMQEVLAPIDFHDHAIDDAQVAARVARASHARLRLLHVVSGDDGERWTVLPQPLAARLEEQLTGARRSQADRAREALEEIAGQVGGAPAPDAEIAHGSAAEQIARVAERADVDLVVMALRGTPGLTGARVGTIAYRVLSSSPVPVLALPRNTGDRSLLPFLD